MEFKIIFRKSWKIFICIAVLSTIQLATSIFALQNVLDGIGITYAQEAYASVGTVYQTNSKSAAFTPIEDQVLTLLSDSLSEDDMDFRKTVSAKIPDMENVPCYFAVPQVNHLLFFRGTVLDITDAPETSSTYRAKYTTVQVEKIYAGQSNWIEAGQTVYVAIICDGELPDEVAVGKQYYFFAQSSFSSQMGLLDTLLYAYNYTDTYISRYEMLQSNYELFHHTIIPVSEGVSQAEADAYALEILEDRGLDVYLDQIANLDHVFTVRMTKDMQMLIPVANEIMFFSEGRGIRPDDCGKNVCVISAELAKLHNIEVGDMVSISLGDSCYNSNGYESGFPAFQDRAEIQYGKPQEYCVIGIYAFSTFDPADATLLFGYNDVFIPWNSTAFERADNVYPYSFSFRIDGSQCDEFIDRYVVELADMGYSVQLSTSRWEDVASAYSAMLTRRNMTLIFAIIAFVLGIIVYTTVIIFFYRREFAIRELFGANFHHTCKAYICPYAVSSLVSAVLTVAASYLIYVAKLLPQTELIAPGRIPEISQILLILVAIVFFQLLTSYIVIIIAAKKFRKQSILRLIK